MGVSEALNELFIFCGKNDIQFRYSSSESDTNKIEIDKQKREVTVTVMDPKDENLELKLTNLKKDLEQLFK